MIIEALVAREKARAVVDVSAPISITVIALEVVASPDNPATVQADFEDAAALFGSLGSVVVDSGGLAATVALEPDADIPAAVGRLDGIVNGFEEQHAPARLRALLHFGTAFRARNPLGVPAFQGSALRSASNSLRRSALGAGIYATADFANLAATFKGVTGFSLASRAAGDFCAVEMEDHSKVYTNELHSTDPELVAWLKSRLARDLGPFASALIDNASHSTRTAKELAAAVGHEIVNPQARQQFDADVFKYLLSRNF